jgi:hypothetical protein
LKTYLNLLIVLFLIIFSSCQLLSQPKYKIELRNIVQTSPTEFEFEIFISKIGGTDERYVKGQYALNYNPKILPDSTILTMAYVFSSSEFPEANQCKLAHTYTGGAMGYVLYIVAPFDNPGCEIPDSTNKIRIGKYKVTSSIPFNSADLNLNWRLDRPNPFSKVWYNSEKLSLQSDYNDLKFELVAGNLKLSNKPIQTNSEESKE